MGQKNNKQNQQDIPKCIFCGKTSLTKEHIWSDWIKNVIPRDDSKRHEHILMSGGRSEHRRPTGHAGSKTLKIVCSDCNNGWMSKIESDAKPILTDLMLEKAIILDRDQQLLIAKWAFLKTIIAEYLDITWQAINSSERKYFYEHKLLPENIGIWIVKNETDKWRYRHLHTGGKVHYSSLSVKCNTQSTIFVIGGLIIYIYKRHDSSFNYPFLGEWGRCLTLIYPHQHKAINWVSIPALNGAQTELLRLNLERVLDLLSLDHDM